MIKSNILSYWKVKKKVEKENFHFFLKCHFFWEAITQKARLSKCLHECTLELNAEERMGSEEKQ